MMSRMQNSLNFLLKRVAVVDVESTITNKGHPFTPENKLVTIQIKVNDEPTKVFTNTGFGEVRAILESCSMVVGTNIKFDLHWLQREIGYQAESVWDLQLAEFLFSDQLWIYPDLDGMCTKYSIPQKLSVVKTQYWEKGIDTDQIPIEILSEYGAYDVEATYAIFQKQLEQFKTDRQHQFFLFRAHCNDLLVLQEMEWNGILYDVEASLAAAEDLNNQIDKIDANLPTIIQSLCSTSSSSTVKHNASCFLLAGSACSVLSNSVCPSPQHIGSDCCVAPRFAIPLLL